MTAVSTDVGTGRRRLSGFAEVVTRWIANAKERRRLGYERRALSQLPDRVLRDLGLEQYAKPPDPIIHHRFL